jgi:hypothetical protein
VTSTSARSRAVSASHSTRRRGNGCAASIPEINGPFLFKEGGNPAEYLAGLELSIGRGWLWRHESGTYVKFTPAGADLFA